MKKGLLVTKTTGEPDKLLFADADTVRAKFRATDKEAILYGCVRIKEKRATPIQQAPATVPVQKAQAPAPAPAPVQFKHEPIQPKKGKV